MMKKQRHFFRQSILAVLFGFSIHAYADFTLNAAGTIITQTGTDTDLSGLSGITGVTTTAQAGITVYNIGNRRLVVSGTLTIDPEIETLLVGYINADLVQVTNGAELIIGRAITQNGFTRYSEGLAIYLDDSGLAFTNRFTFQNGGNLTWNGGIISMQAGRFGFYGDNCTVRINSINAKLIYRTQSARNQLRQETDDFISTAFDFINGDLTIVGTGQQLSGYRPTHCTGAIAFSGATPNVDVVIRGYAGGGRGNERDVKFWTGCRPYFVNSASGTEINAGHHANEANSFGVLRVFQDLSVNVKEFGAGNIEGAKLYFQDYDNGVRRLYNQEAPSIDLTGTFTYTGTSDVNGDIASQEVLTGAVVADTSYGAVSSGVNTGLYAWDYRSKNGDTTDLFDLNIWSYNHFYLLISNVALKGVNGAHVDAVMFVDNMLTETDKSVVDAYTEIDNLDELYDRAKSWKLANIEKPTIDTQLITGDGNSLDLGAFDLVVDAAAANAFNVNTTSKTITIKSADLLSGDKFTTITTTGTISTANGAFVDFGYIDSTGTNKYVRLNNLMNWDVNVIDNSDPTAPTDILAETGVTGDYRKHFIYNGEIEIVVELTFANVVFFSETFPQPDLDFIRSDFIVKATEENQERMLYLLERILLNEEGISETLRATTPNGVINVTNTTTDSEATLENQEEIVKFLERIMLKTSTTREVLKQEE